MNVFEYTVVLTDGVVFHVVAQDTADARARVKASGFSAAEPVAVFLGAQHPLDYAGRPIKL